MACDELLFLPGTAHGNSTESAPAGASNNVLLSQARQQVRLEGDVAAGGWATTHDAESHPQHQQVVVEMIATNAPDLRLAQGTSCSRARSLSRDSSLSSINEFANSWDEDDTTRREDDDVHATSEDVDDEENLMAPLNFIGLSPDTASEVSERTHERLQLQSNSANRNVVGSIPDTRSPVETHTRAERFIENHPNVTRFGSFFFFRSSTTSTHNATYAPSGPSVVGAAIDLSMPVLFNFHLFIEAWNHLDVAGSETPAKILPLIFLSVLIVRAVFPPGRRGRFWSTMKFTATAPFHRCRFRDIYVGDILTSLVRPLQDVVFALAYYVTVIWGTVTSKYDLSDSGRILETSWVLHNVVLPSCALLPLWWKFLQTLRECYDTGRRWPYLGNAFKYLTASTVILYGMTHPEDRRSLWWIVAFCFALAYQIFWDTVMDWDLLIIAPKENEGLDISESSWLTSPISSVRPDCHWLLAMQRNILPVREFVRLTFARIPSLKQIQIRPRRLYKSEMFYWKILAYNTVFRFCWMLSFIPAYHLSASGRDVITTFSSDTHSYVGVLLPIAEILRRALWGFLFLELQTIKMSDGDHVTYQYSPIDLENLEESELSSVSVDSSKPASRQYLPAWLGMQQQLQHEAATTTSSWKLVKWFQCSEGTRHNLFVAELALWAVAFVGLGMWATT